MRERHEPAYLAVGDSAWLADGTIDPEGIFKGSVLVGTRWNGWAIPCFTREEVQKVIDYLTKCRTEYSDPDTEVLEWQDRDPPPDYASPTRERLVLRTFGGEFIEDCGPDDAGLYWPGAFSWTWAEVDAETLEEAGIDPTLRNL